MSISEIHLHLSISDRTRNHQWCRNSAQTVILSAESAVDAGEHWYRKRTVDAKIARTAPRVQRAQRRIAARRERWSSRETGRREDVARQHIGLASAEKAARGGRAQTRCAESNRHEEVAMKQSRDRATRRRCSPAHRLSKRREGG